MRGIERRIERLEEKAGTGGPLILNIYRTIVGMDGEIERVEEKVITVGGAGGN